MPRVDRNDSVPAIRDHLRDRAHVFEDPGLYVAGVEDALESVQELEKAATDPT